MKLYVGNLPKRVTDAQLNELAVPFGALISASVAIERGSGTSRGFGFVEYGNEEHARAAIAALNGHDIDGNTLKVNEAKPRA